MRPSSGSRTPVVKRHADVVATTEAVLESYVPVSLDRSRWSICREFVQASARDLAPANAQVAHTMIKTISPFVVWCLGEGLPLERERIFRPDVVERYTTVGCERLAPASRATVRSNLRRYGPLLTRKAPWPPAPAPVRSHGGAPPYSESEIDRITEVCAHQRTATKRHQMQTLLALALGAGLTPQEVWYAVPGDVIRHFGLVCVLTRGTAGRVVPVTAPHDAMLWDLKDRFSNNSFWSLNARLTTRTRISRIVDDADVPSDCPSINVPRLRTTWVLRHLEAGVDLAGLARMAGVKTTSVFETALPYMRHVRDEDLFPALVRR